MLSAQRPARSSNSAALSSFAAPVATIATLRQSRAKFETGSVATVATLRQFGPLCRNVAVVAGGEAFALAKTSSMIASRSKPARSLFSAPNDDPASAATFAAPPNVAMLVQLRDGLFSRRFRAQDVGAAVENVAQSKFGFAFGAQPIGQFDRVAQSRRLSRHAREPQGFGQVPGHELATGGHFRAVYFRRLRIGDDGQDASDPGRIFRRLGANVAQAFKRLIRRHALFNGVMKADPKPARFRAQVDNARRQFIAGGVGCWRRGSNRSMMQAK